MAYEQIDGNKSILVNEKGQLREELRNIEPDYEYDESGNIDTDQWPTVVVQSDSEGTDRRLLPAEVLKIHGDLAQNGQYTANMFDAEDGDKTNCARENIIFEDRKPKSPYKEDPKKAEGDPETDEDEPSGKVVHDPIKESDGAAEDGGSETDEDDDGRNSSGNTISSQSQDFNVDEAVEVIRNNTFGDLVEANFYNEESGPKEKRITVEEAWEKKKQNRES